MLTPPNADGTIGDLIAHHEPQAVYCDTCDSLAPVVVNMYIISEARWVCVPCPMHWAHPH